MQSDVVLSDSMVVETLDELHENGEDAISLDPTTLKYGEFVKHFVLKPQVEEVHY